MKKSVQAGPSPQAAKEFVWAPGETSGVSNLFLVIPLSSTLGVSIWSLRCSAQYQLGEESDGIHRIEARPTTQAELFSNNILLSQTKKLILACTDYILKRSSLRSLYPFRNNSELI